MVKLFPPYLDAGSSGAAVDALHVFLILYDMGEGIVRDGEYGAVTVERVKDFQRELGFEEEDVDGNFGPKTRAAFAAEGLRFDEIPLHETADNTTTWNGPDVEGAEWPPHRPPGDVDDSDEAAD